jgi:mannose-1-phosphate guanylyltransferase
MDLAHGPLPGLRGLREEARVPATGRLWAILLAAGEGRRVRSLTGQVEGRPVPKQFCTMDGRGSMLRWAIDRAAGIVPVERIVVIVASHHRRWWGEELADLPAANVVVQPQNRGTGVGILLPLLNVLQRDPEARVLILPTDHYLEDEQPLREAIVEGVRAVHADRDRVVLLGMAPQERDAECGWILPESAAFGVGRVSNFVEKPNAEKARALARRGAVVNSLILVGTGAAMLRLYTETVPDVVESFRDWRNGTASVWRDLESLYDTLPVCDFSREILERSCDHLSVVRVSGSGWMDLGTPDRLQLFRRQQVPVKTMNGPGPTVAGPTQEWHR